MTRVKSLEEHFERAGRKYSPPADLRALWENSDAKDMRNLFLAAEQAASFGNIDVLRFAVEDCKLESEYFDPLIMAGVEGGWKNVVKFMAAQPGLDLHTNLGFPRCDDFLMMLAVDNTISDGGERRKSHNEEEATVLVAILYRAMIARVAAGTDTPQKVFKAVRVARDQAAGLVEPKRQELIEGYGREDSLPKIEFEDLLRSLQKRVDGGVAAIKKDAQLFSVQTLQRKLAL